MKLTRSQIIQLNSSYFPYSALKHFHVFEKGRDPVCDWIISSQQLYEHYVLMMITPILRECSYLVDIGCHIGTYTFAKMLTGNNGSTLSIDASRENIELAKKNSLNHPCFNSIHGFWVEKNNSNTHTLISNKFKGNHNKLHSSITNSPGDSFAIPNIKTTSICDWIEQEIQRSGSEKNPGLIKIDIDGSELNTSKELCASLIQLNTPFIMLIETGKPKVIEALNDIGMKPLALLPGNNFLVCCQEALIQRKSLFLINETFGLITAFLNMTASDDDWLRRTGTKRDNKPVTIQTTYGKHKSESSIVNDYWPQHLSKYNIPMFCYG